MSKYEKVPWGKKVSYKSPITGRETTLYSIATLAEALGRTSQTVRKWEVAGIIPQTPFRVSGKRMYTEEHIDAIVECAEKAKLSSGNNISNTNFSKNLYKEFERINDLFFKKEGEQ